MHSDSVFVTFTYNDENLPFDGGLQPLHFTNFMKRLRPRVGNPLQYFMCGEYGDKFGRPHYHAIIFGLDFPDKIPHKQTEAGEWIYTSPVLDFLWQKGHCSIGAVTQSSAAYVARYTTKKVYGAKASRHYQKIDPVTGEIHNVRGEYVRMSLKRPIGKAWLQEFKTDVYPSDEVIIDGYPQKPPAFYDKQLSETERTPIKEKRKAASLASKDNTRARLEVREQVKLAKIKQLQRGLQ